MNTEMSVLAGMGIQNILLLTGESRSHTPPQYLQEAVEIAGSYFPSISLEVYPLTTDEYRTLFLAGVDGVTLYQETYDRDRYQTLHRSGNKRNYDFRYQAPARMAEAGIRSISMGVLLGLSPVADDIYHLFGHIRSMEKKFPGVEYNVSFPRLVPLKNSQFTYYYPVTDEVLVKLICLARILFPRIGINLSTRELANFRNHAIELGVTRLSAASRTTVGGYHDPLEDEGQFDVQDGRSLEEVVQLLKEKGFDPVFTDWRRIPNQSL
jgi:2-iminoacetate synthase